MCINWRRKWQYRIQQSRRCDTASCIWGATAVRAPARRMRLSVGTQNLLWHPVQLNVSGNMTAGRKNARSSGPALTDKAMALPSSLGCAITVQWGCGSERNWPLPLSVNKRESLRTAGGGKNIGKRWPRGNNYQQRHFVHEDEVHTFICEMVLSSTSLSIWQPSCWQTLLSSFPFASVFGFRLHQQLSISAPANN